MGGLPMKTLRLLASSFGAATKSRLGFIAVRAVLVTVLLLLPPCASVPAASDKKANHGLINQRWLHTATLLSNGMVLVTGGKAVGGDKSGKSIANAELYDSVRGTWTATASLGT